MRPQPLVSICIPCYNGAEFISRTVESVLAQTLTDYELLIADNKSTDATVAIVNRFSDSRIRLIQNERNLGMALNWERVMSQSEGKYVKLLCADDLLHPTCLSRQVQVLEDPLNSKVVLAICNRKIINGEDEVVLTRRLPFASGVVPGRLLIRRSIRFGSNLVGEPAVGLFRRDALQRIHMWDSNNAYLSDLALWAELLRHGDAFVDKECLAAFRISGGAATASIGRSQAACFRSFARTLANDRFYTIGALDAGSGYALSFMWCLLRNLFISFHCRPCTKPGHAARLFGFQQGSGFPGRAKIRQRREIFSFESTAAECPALRR